MVGRRGASHAPVRASPQSAQADFAAAGPPGAVSTASRRPPGKPVGAVQWSAPVPSPRRGLRRRAGHARIGGTSGAGRAGRERRGESRGRPGAKGHGMSAETPGLAVRGGAAPGMPSGDDASYLILDEQWMVIGADVAAEWGAAALVGQHVRDVIGEAALEALQRDGRAYFLLDGVDHVVSLTS